jgi:nucleoid-associated protein YgaU
VNIYLTVGHTRVHFPMNPEQIQVTYAAHMESFNVLERGGISLPRGTEATQVSWDGILPGPARRHEPYVKSWKEPKSIFYQLDRWKTDGTRARLLITETPINFDVYISQLQPTFSGGFGDMNYHIELVAARTLTVSDGTRHRSSKSSRSKSSAPKTYKVKPGDALFTIAKRFSGSGSNWPQLYSLNKSVIGPNPNLLKVGIVLRIPSGW